MIDEKCPQCGQRLWLGHAGSCPTLAGAQHPPPAQPVGVDPGIKYSLDSGGRMVPVQPNESVGREWWICFSEQSNQALYRIGAEKYPDDVNSEPGPRWRRVIEHSAYLAVCQERDDLVMRQADAALFIGEKTIYWTGRIAELERERDALKATLNHPTSERMGHFIRERNEARAAIGHLRAAAKGCVADNNLKHEDASRNLEKLEHALSATSGYAEGDEE